MAGEPLDSDAKQAVAAATAQLKSAEGRVALKQGADLARKIDDNLRAQEHLDPTKLHERVTR
jgi:hypothetical protein